MKKAFLALVLVLSMVGCGGASAPSATESSDAVTVPLAEATTGKEPDPVVRRAHEEFEEFSKIEFSSTWEDELKGDSAEEVAYCKSAYVLAKAEELGQQVTDRVAPEKLKELQKRALTAYVPAALKFIRDDIRPSCHGGEVDLDRVVARLKSAGLSPEDVGTSVEEIREVILLDYRRDVPELVKRALDGSADASGALWMMTDMFTTAQLGIAESDWKKIQGEMEGGS